jgi:hypothetical protein
VPEDPVLTYIRAHGAENPTSTSVRVNEPLLLTAIRDMHAPLPTATPSGNGIEILNR